MVDTSSDWAVALLEVDMGAPLPANANTIQAFLEGDMPKELPALPTLLHKLLADADTKSAAETYLSACGAAQNLATTVGYVSVSHRIVTLLGLGRRTCVSVSHRIVTSPGFGT